MMDFQRLFNEDELRQMFAQQLATERLKCEVRDYVRHHWRIATGQIPPHSPMATSWSGHITIAPFGIRVSENRLADEIEGGE